MNKLKDLNAGITSEAAVTAVGNRYDLVLIAAQRVRELNQGRAAKIFPRYGSLVTAQVEIEQGLVGRDYLKRDSTQPVKRKKPRTYHA